jgi:PAS domain S-box-containing protein
MTAIDRQADTVLILAPRGRDAPVAAALLREAGTEALVCADLAHLQALLNADVCCAVVTEEALRDADLTQVAAWVTAQPEWSDFPFIILTHRGQACDRSFRARALIRTFGNVVFLERPFHPMTFVSVVATAQRGRHRQYEARWHMEALRESEARLRTALNAGQLGQWELDLPPTRVTASAATRMVLGHSASGALTYADFEACLHRDDLGRMRDAIKRSSETHADVAIEFRCVWADDSLHWVDFRARHVLDREGRAARLVGVSSDITARKAAEANMQRMNETLEAKVHARTAQLERAHQTMLDEIRQREHAEEVLRQVQKMEMIGQLTGGVAHDFNNLLMAVMGNLELLRKQVRDDKLARLAEGALQGARRGASLTQRLLAFARQQDLRIESVHLSRLISGMADLLERSVGANIELVLELPEELPLTLADANQIELALLNLVVNARDAMPEGGVISITVDGAHASDHVDLAGGDYLRVSVVDKGCGMNAATLSKAMEPFFTTKEFGKGTGLGLSMVHGLALQLNGALRLESTVGRGTRAELWLPAAPHAAVEPAQAATTPDESEVVARGVTILLVDDDALISDSTAYLLEDLGHEVIKADSGANALEVLRSGKKVDLLITDYSMPKMTGMQLAHAARELRPDLPIVIATGYADLPLGAAMGIVRLRKPYQQHQLVTEIAKALSMVR